LQVYIQKFTDEVKRVWRGIQQLRSFRFVDFGKILKEMTRSERTWAAVLAVVLLADVVGLGTHWYVTHTVLVPAHGGTYVEGEVGQPQYINPLLAQSDTDDDLTAIVYSGLYKSDSSGNLVPDLADGPIQFSADKKQYTVKLKQNLKWQDGRPITADDVVFTVATIQNPSFHAVQYRQWTGITVQKLDDLTVRFTNPTVSAPFLTNFTVGILPQHIWQNVAAGSFSVSPSNLEPIGSGPFTATEKDVQAGSGSLTSYTFTANQLYWQGKPYIDSVQFRFFNAYQDALLALHSNEIQGLGFTPFDTKVDVAQAHTNLQVRQVPLYQYQALFFNLPNSQGVLSDVVVRHALSQSVDRGALIKDVYGGQALPDYGPLMPGQLGYTDGTGTYPLSLDAANSQLSADGWSVDAASGIRTKGKAQLTFTVTTNDFVLNVKTAENLQAQWKKIGANVLLNVVPTADIQAKVIQPRSYQALLFAEGTGVDPDPFVFWHSSQAQFPGANLALYKNVTADALIASARSTLDQGVRAAAYQKFQGILAADDPAIFLVQSEFVYETTPSLRADLPATLANPRDRFYDIQHWYVQEARTFRKK
jgi:peptide/nickel transport system substrate-binding protein